MYVIAPQKCLGIIDDPFVSLSINCRSNAFTDHGCTQRSCRHYFGMDRHYFVLNCFWSWLHLYKSKFSSITIILTLLIVVLFLLYVPPIILGIVPYNLKNHCFGNSISRCKSGIFIFSCHRHVRFCESSLTIGYLWSHCVNGRHSQLMVVAWNKNKTFAGNFRGCRKSSRNE